MRELYDRILAERAVRGVSADVPPEDILSVVEHRGSEAERAAILNRLLSTAEGRRELDLVRAAVAAAKEPRRLRPWVPLAIAATLAVAMVSRVVLRDDVSNDQVRGEPGSAIALLAPAEELNQLDSTRFVWTRLAAASSYQVELLDEPGNTVWTETVADTSAALPAGVRLTPGQTYRWRVIVRTETGEVASPLRIMKVRR